MYKIIDTAANLTQAQSSVDAMTGPVKNITKNFKVGKLINERTPGNAFNKAESIEDNQVGKDGISICAVGMKTFFGLTEYFNYIANRSVTGTDEEREAIRKQKERIELGRNKRIEISVPGEKEPRVYKYFANINPKIGSELYKTLSETYDDSDAALDLSALLSLATDNAKELQLSKLNAGIKTLGMYVFGVSIGMDIESVSKIMTSDVGLLLTDLTKSNVFTGEKGIFSISKVFDYLETGPRDTLSKYDETKIVNNKVVPNYIEYLSKSLGIKYGVQNLSPYYLFAKFAWDNSTNVYAKIEMLESLKGLYKYGNTTKEVTIEDKQKYNQLIDELEEYIRQVNIVKENE
jgi:hypothetical protein